MLLIIEALLISAVLGQDHRTDDDEEQIFPLDMEENSVDDVFVGCKMNMSDQVKTELLEKELDNSPIFKAVWQKSEENATIPVYDNLTWNHSVAIYVYTNSHSDLHEDFNNAVSADKQKYENKIFTWYSLYFLLAEAIQILKEVQNVCKLTYRGTDVEFDNNVLNKEVRFGRFASSSLDRTVATLFGNKSCFEIKTCEGADVKYYSTFPEEEEVLIPPYEKFKVTDIMKIEDHADLWCDTVYKLESTGIRSDLNCAFFRNQAETSQTSTFNNIAFCRCFQRKLRTLHSRYRIYQSVQFIGKLQGCYSQHQLQRHGVYPTGREIHSDIHSWPYPLRGHRHDPTDPDIHSDIHSWPYPLRGHRHDPTDPDIHLDIHSRPYPLRGHRHDPTDPDIHSANQLNQRWLCYRLLHSLRIDHKILALLRPCCRV